MTLLEIFNERLHQMFSQLADDISTGKILPDLTEDEAAGIPLMLFRAENMLRTAFEGWCLQQGKEKENEQESKSIT